MRVLCCCQMWTKEYHNLPGAEVVLVVVGTVVVVVVAAELIPGVVTPGPLVTAVGEPIKSRD